MKNDNNKFVNTKDFGVIAKSTTSSRGSNTPTQVGNDNQREFYNANRGKNRHDVPTVWGGVGPKVSTKELSSAEKGIPKRLTKERRQEQRAGGKAGGVGK